MKVTGLVQIEWGDALKKTILCKSVYGDMPLETVASLKEKLQNRNLLTPIRKIYQDMLDFAQSSMGNNTDENTNRRRDDEGSGRVE